jgi:hypothetical protein
MKSQKDSEQKESFYQEVTETLSRRGITIKSSKTTPSGVVIHECSVKPGATIISKPPKLGKK